MRRIGSGSRAIWCSRPARVRRTSPARSSTFTCFETALNDMSKGWARSVTRAAPFASRWTISRRVGSESAAKARSRTEVGIYSTYRLNIAPGPPLSSDRRSPIDENPPGSSLLQLMWCPSRARGRRSSAEAEPFHDDEAQGVAERVRLVLVRAQEGAGPFVVALPNPFDVVGVIAHHVEEGQGAPPAAPRSDQQSEYVSTTTAFVVTRRQRSAFARENRDRAWSWKRSSAARRAKKPRYR